MRLRTKSLLAQAPLVVALVVLGGVGSLAVTALGRRTERILRDNYRSVLAAQRMKEALERIDSGALFLVAGHRGEGMAEITPHRERLEAELAVEEANITEPGEAAAAGQLRADWHHYSARLDRFVELRDPGQLRDAYFGELAPAFQRVKRGADAILAINQDAMVLKSDRAQRLAARLNAVIVAAAVASVLLGLMAAAWMTSRLLRPVSVLGQAVQRLGEGDLAARARVTAKDEIGEVAREFNTMADRLEQYRKSSLGELFIAQRASQAAIDSLPDPVIVLGPGRDILAVNTAAEKTLGVHLEATDPLGALPRDLAEVIERLRGHTLAGKGAWTPRGLEDALRVRAEDGEHAFLPRATPLYAEEGGVAGTSVVLQDVTRLLHLDEVKTDLVATVAHEFRTPLTSLRMAIHLCLEGAAGPITDKQAELLHAGREDCERLQSTLDDLLDLSRVQSGTIELAPRRTGVEDLVNAAIEATTTVAGQRQVRLRSEVLPGLGDVFADPDRLQIVFANLITNGVRHSPEAGEIVVRALAEDGSVRFEVSDEGPGIPPELHGRLFDRFFRVPGMPAGGAGLGLYIARQLVEAHGGEIGVVSRVGRGTTFWFRVPRGGAESERQPSPS